jgi:hypothetical protein
MEEKIGTVVCNACNGVGWIETEKRLLESLTMPKLLRPPKHRICPKCFGRINITWLEQVFGLQPRKVIKSDVEGFEKNELFCIVSTGSNYEKTLYC